MIKAIPYERIEQKNEIEREMFSKLTQKERRSMAQSWTKLMSLIDTASSKKSSKKSLKA